MNVPHGLFVGLTTFDLINYVDSFPRADEKVQATARWSGAGGPAANAAYAFGALGGRATLVTALGASLFANAAYEDLRRGGVAVVNLVDDGELAISAVTVDSKGQRSVISGNASGFDAQEISGRWRDRILPAVDVLVFDSHYPELVERIVPQSPPGTPAIFDPGTVKPQTPRLLPLATHVIASRSFDDSLSDEQIMRSLGGDHQLVALTRGEHEILVAEMDRKYTVAAPRVRVVDTLGAGDVLHGSFAYHLALGKDAAQAMRESAVIAARVCERHGPRVGSGG